MRTIGRPLYKTIGRVVGKGAHLGSKLNPYWETPFNLNPVAYWPLWDNLGSESVLDISGNELNAIPTNITLGTTGIGDGKTSGKFLSSNLAIYSAGLNSKFKGDSGTLMAWSKIDAAALTDGANHYITQIKVDASNYVQIIKSTGNNQYKLIYKAGGVENSITINDVTSTEWICWMISWNKASNEVKFYQNGIPLAPTTCDGIWSGSLLSSQTIIGGYNTSSTYSWKGNIAHVALFDYAVTNTQAKSCFRNYGFQTGFPPTLWAYRAAAPLVTPTYDDSGQTVHPAIVYEPEGWNGYKYWMGITPYTNTDNTTERPSVLASNDGQTWEVPTGGTNPVIDEPYQSDPDLVIDGNGKMWLIWRKNMQPNAPIKITGSTDGITWDTPSILFETAYNACLSPSVVWDGNKWIMFLIDLTVASPYQILRRTADVINGVWSEPTVCNGVLPSGLTHWHLDVIVSGNRLLGLFNVNETKLLYGFSDDWGLTWKFDERVFMDTAVGVWDAGLYRSTLLKKNADVIEIWYSAQNAGVWGTGYTQANIVRPERT